MSTSRETPCILEPVFEKVNECWNSGTINTCITHMRQLLCAAKVPEIEIVTA